MEPRVHIALAGRRFGAPLLLSVAAMVLFFVPGARSILEYDRAAVTAGEVWRIVTCQLIHANFEHLLWDAATVLVLGLVISSRRPGLFLLVAAGSLVAVPLGVHFALPSLATFCGLSGIACALFAAFAVTLLVEFAREGRWRLVAATSLLGAALMAKVTFEAVTGTAIFVDLAAAAMIPVPLAHLLGAAAGSAGAVASSAVTAR